MKTDYKISTIKDSAKVLVNFNFYEGDITTENELDMFGALVPVTRYRRFALLKTEQKEYSAGTKNETLQTEGNK